MTPQDVIDYFGGTQDSAGRWLGVSQASVQAWLAEGEVPWLRQCGIEILTKGALKAEPPSEKYVIKERPRRYVRRYVRVEAGRETGRKA